MAEQFKKEILIVDDEMDFRLDLAEMLVEQGYKVSTARNGVDAINHLNAAERLPDLITLDVKMPVLDGLRFKEELKNRFGDIPVIMISGFLPDQEDTIDGIRAAFSKPIDKFHFLNTLESETVFRS